MRSREALQQCYVLKEQIIVDGAIDWERRFRLQQFLERVLLSDLDYGLSKQAEQMLWNSCFKSIVDFYQLRLKNQKTDEDSALLGTFLASSVGFFTQLITKLCRLYRFNLSTNCIKSDSYLGILNGHMDKRRRASKTNLIYFAQYCLIHLGDVARYQKRLNEAETFYLNACHVCQSNGHPFNQLAILETSRSRCLSSIYLYTRSLYVENPFAFASSNLDNFYSTIDLSLSTQSYVDIFFKFMAVVHLVDSGNFQNAENSYLKHLNTELKFSILNDLLSCHDLMHVSIIAVGNVWKINSSKNPNSLNSNVLSLSNFDEIGNSYIEFSKDEKVCLNLLIKFLQQLFQNLLSLSMDDTVKDAERFLPVLYILSCWLRIYVGLLHVNEFCCASSQFLPVLCKFLNSFVNKNEENNFPSNQDVSYVPEDLDFKGFLPLEASLDSFDAESFHSMDLPKNVEYTNSVRRKRLVEFGKTVVENVNSKELMDFKIVESEDRKSSVEFCTSIILEENQQSTLAKKSADEKCVKFKPSVIEDKPNDSVKPSMKRHTKVLPLLTIFEKEKSGKDTLGDATDTSTTDKDADNIDQQQQQPKIKIAAPGSKVDLPLASEKRNADDDENSDEKSLSASNATSEKSSRYELPPRFQAAKLKYALTGVAAPPSSSAAMSAFFDKRPPPGGAPPSGLNFASFPPLVPPQPPLSWTPDVGGGGAGQTTMTSSSMDFHKTPGVRPRGPPPFPLSAFNRPPPSLARLPPPPFSFGRPKLMDNNQANNFPPASRQHQEASARWPPAPPDVSMFANSSAEDRYFSMWQQKPPMSMRPPPPMPPPIPPGTGFKTADEIWSHWSRSGGGASFAAPPSGQFPGAHVMSRFPGFGQQHQQQQQQSYLQQDDDGSDANRAEPDRNQDEQAAERQFSLFGVGGHSMEYPKWSSGGN